MFSKPTRNYKAVFSINENKHAIKHKLKYEIKKDTKMDFPYMQTDHTRVSSLHLYVSYKRKTHLRNLKLGK